MATVAEIYGGSFDRTSQGDGDVDSAVRKFRILRATPDETIDIIATCGIGIGDYHPYNPGIYCTRFSGEAEGDSRLSLICTFTYGSIADTSGGGSGSKGNGARNRPPELRPANWSVSTTTMEAPAAKWWSVPEGIEQLTINPAGDYYDGVTRLRFITTIDVTCFSTSPSQHYSFVGNVNSSAFSIGTLLTAPTHSLLFSGLRSEPAIESFAGGPWRGFKNTYEFRYDPDKWYITVPLSGFNVLAFAPAQAGANDDVYGQPLMHVNRRIATPLALPPQIAAGEKVRAMVKVFEYEDGGTSQAPSAQPIPLTQTGRPSKVVDTQKKRPYGESDFNVFNIIFE
jgi:hypothetical protein